MAKQKYDVSGSGKSSEDADKSLGRSKSDLLKRLGVDDSSIEVQSAHYSAQFTLKGECTSDACATCFKVESDKGWDPLLVQARRVGRDLDRYEGQYEVTQTLLLTAEQVEKTRARRPPAGYETRNPSILREGLRI